MRSSDGSGSGVSLGMIDRQSRLGTWDCGCRRTAVDRRRAKARRNGRLAVDRRGPGPRIRLWPSLYLSRCPSCYRLDSSETQTRPAVHSAAHSSPDRRPCHSGFWIGLARFLSQHAVRPNLATRNLPAGRSLGTVTAGAIFEVSHDRKQFAVLPGSVATQPLAGRSGAWLAGCLPGCLAGGGVRARGGAGSAAPIPALPPRWPARGGGRRTRGLPGSKGGRSRRAPLCNWPATR